MNTINSYYSKNRSVMRQFLPDSYAKVLEVGCGAGIFSSSLKEGCEVWGIEPNQNSASAASESLSKVLQGTYESVADSLPEGYFDLIICNDVIEHMCDHVSFLRSIKKKLRSNGHIVGSLPNVRHYRNLYELLILKDWKYRSEGILDSTHFRFFTEKSMEQIFEQEGYTIEYMKGINPKSMSRYDVSGITRTFLLGLVSLASLGYYSDIKYLQFGFRLRI
jgi:2-polyprenyl-3-methyl-5-hydroxy-6-metoxy-1,4-benzoquinol methylase